MKFPRLGAAAVLAALTVSSLAQGAGPDQPGSGMRPCAAAPASAPAGDCPNPPARGKHRMGHRGGREDTPGWALMTAEERRKHVELMRSMKDYGECKAYMDKHRDEMAERARKLGRPSPPQARRDACAPLKRSQP